MEILAGRYASASASSIGECQGAAQTYRGLQMSSRRSQDQPRHAAAASEKGRAARSGQLQQWVGAQSIANFQKLSIALESPRLFRFQNLGFQKCGTALKLLGSVRTHRTTPPRVEALQAAECERIFSEKASGKSTSGRPEFARLMKALGNGGVLQTGPPGAVEPRPAEHPARFARDSLPLCLARRELERYHDGWS
jgi:hypothetical protein